MSPLSALLHGHVKHYLFFLAGDVMIQGDMMFNMDSDLNEDSPQFSLTCTSTGGPVTSVAWRRNFTSLSGGMTVLDDPVTAQYTHTLTLNERLGARTRYRCAVSNNKISGASAQLTVQGEV